MTATAIRIPHLHLSHTTLRHVSIQPGPAGTGTGFGMSGSGFGMGAAMAVPTAVAVTGIAMTGLTPPPPSVGNGTVFDDPGAVNVAGD